MFYFILCHFHRLRIDEIPFIDAINEFTPEVAHEVTPEVAKLLNIIDGDMSRAELQQALGLRDQKSFRERYLVPALHAGLIAMTLPEKPNSRLQKYRKK